MKSIFLTATFLFLNLISYTQDPPKREVCSNMSIWVEKDGKFFANADVSINLEYKNAGGEVVYSEEHTGKTNDFAHLIFVVGKGDNKSGELTAEMFKNIEEICYSGEVDDMGTPVTFSSTLTLGSANRAAYAYRSESAETALKTDTWGDIKFSDKKISSDVLFSTYFYSAPNIVMEVDKESVRLPLSEIFSTGSTTAIPSNLQRNMLQLFKKNNLSYSFGAGSITNPVENQFTFNIDTLDGLNHGVGVCIGVATSNNPTAAIHVKNPTSLGVGVFAESTTDAFFGQANNGVTGISLSGTSGSGVRGIVGDGPSGSSVKIGVLGDSNNQANSWGIFGNGPVGGTGAYIQGSDSRLKQNAHHLTGALQKVLQMKPMIYQYKAREGYAFPEGDQIGFMAQDMESVLPEIVVDLALPTTYALEGKEGADGEPEVFKGIQYASITPVLAGAIKELNAKIETQQEEIEWLKAQIKLLIEKE